METDRVLLVVCLTLFIVIGVNASIYSLLRRGDAFRQIDLFRKAASRARDPWHHEDNDLNELSSLVKQLRDKGEQTGSEPPQASQE